MERQRRDELAISPIHDFVRAAKAAAKPDQLKSFNPTDGLVQFIDDELAKLDLSLNFKVQQFLTGLDGRLSNSGPDAAKLVVVHKQEVPAADRYVTVTDNSKGKIRSELDELRTQIRGDNEADDESRLVALSEIAAFEETIIQPRVATELIERFVATVLKWIASVFSKATVSEVAKRLIEALTRIV